MNKFVTLSYLKLVMTKLFKVSKVNSLEDSLDETLIHNLPECFQGKPSETVIEFPNHASIRDATSYLGYRLLGIAMLCSIAKTTQVTWSPPFSASKRQQCVQLPPKWRHREGSTRQQPGIPECWTPRHEASFKGAVMAPKTETSA